MAFYSSKLVKEKPKKKSSLLGIFIVFIILLLVGAYVALTMTPLQKKVAYYSCYWDSSIVSALNGPEGKALPITIDSGDTTLAIGTKLQEQGIVARAEDFYCYVKKINAGDKLQAGYYEISTPIAIEQLVPYLEESRIPTVRFTIQEGLRIDEIATKLDNAFGGSENTIRKFSKTEFVALTVNKERIDALSFAKGKTSLEGFLFPDTYDIQKNATAADVIDLLTSTFQKKVANTTLAQSTPFSPYQTIILASLVEREAGSSTYEEKQMIAGILQKRVQSGWLLNVDATILYEKKDWRATITVADQMANTPFNTYKYAGFTPTPICNPGLESIQSALSPKSSPYWYYLHGNDNKVHYGATYQEHLSNIELYLR